MTRFFARLLRLRTLAQMCRYGLRRIMFQPAPESAFTALTYACDYRCVHCAVSEYASARAPLTLDAWKIIIDQLALSGVFRVYLGGGEPTLSSELDAVIAHCARRGVLTFLETHGGTLSAARMEKLRACGLSCVVMTLHSSDAMRHDAFTGYPGSWQAVCDAFALCRKADIPAMVTIVDDGIKNTAEIDAVMRTAVKCGAAAVRLTAAHAVGRWRQHRPAVVRAGRFRTRMPVPVFDRRVVRRCRIGATVYITADGQLQPCEFIPYAFGSLTHERLLPVVRRMMRHAMFRRPMGCRVDDPGFQRQYIEGIAGREMPVRCYGG